MWLHMIWFLFWIAFVLFVGWLFARSMKTVWGQQKAWTMFARKHDLIVTKGKWYQAPRIEGEVNGRRMSVYVEEVVDPVLRVREFRTTVEMYLKTGLPTGIAIGSRAYTNVLSEIENVEKVTLPEDKAFSGLRSVAREVKLFETWKNMHIEALKTFFAIKRSERLLMGHETDGFLILQTADNLDDVTALNNQVKQLFALAKDIENSVEAESIASPDVDIEQVGDTTEPDINNDDQEEQIETTETEDKKAVEEK